MSLPLSAAPNSVSSSRVQIECVKQSTHNVDSWSARVVTLDTATSTLTVSRHRRPSDVFYHSLQPSIVQTWPHFSNELVSDDFYSREAKLTLCVLGTVAAVPEFREDEVALLAIPVPPASAEILEAAGTAYPPSEYTSITAAAAASATTNTLAAGKTRREKAGKFDAWVLRFPTKAAYTVALQVLGQLPGLRFAQAATALRTEGGSMRKKEVCFSTNGLGPLTMMMESSQKGKRHTRTVR